MNTTAHRTHAPSTGTPAQKYSDYLIDFARHVELTSRGNPQRQVFLCLLLDEAGFYTGETLHTVALRSAIKRFIRSYKYPDSIGTRSWGSMRRALTTRYGADFHAPSCTLNELRARWLRDLAKYHAARGN